MKSIAKMRFSRDMVNIRILANSILKKHYIILMFLIILLLFAAVFPSTASPRVLMIVREKSEDLKFWLKNEATEMIALLHDRGFEVDVGTVSGEQLESGPIKLNANIKLSEVQLSNYDGVIVPCMGAGDYSVPDICVSILREANSAGMIIAAQHSFEILRPAGLMEGHNVSISPGIVIDQNLITSYNCPYMASQNNKPADTKALIEAFVEAVSRR